MPGHWRGLQNIEFLNLFQKFGQLLYGSKTAGIMCVTSYSLRKYKKKGSYDIMTDISENVTLGQLME